MADLKTFLSDLNPLGDSPVQDDIFTVFRQGQGPPGQGQPGQGQPGPGPQGQPGQGQQPVLPAETPEATKNAIEQLRAQINALEASGPTGPAASVVQPGPQPGSQPRPMLQKKGLKNKAKQLKEIKQNGGADLYEYKYLKYKTKYENLLSKLN